MGSSQPFQHPLACGRARGLEQHVDVLLHEVPQPPRLPGQVEAPQLDPRLALEVALDRWRHDLGGVVPGREPVVDRAEVGLGVVGVGRAAPEPFPDRSREVVRERVGRVLAPLALRVEPQRLEERVRRVVAGVGQPPLDGVLARAEPLADQCAVPLLVEEPAARDQRCGIRVAEHEPYRRRMPAAESVAHVLDGARRPALVVTGRPVAVADPDGVELVAPGSPKPDGPVPHGRASSPATPTTSSTSWRQLDDVGWARVVAVVLADDATPVVAPAPALDRRSSTSTCAPAAPGSSSPSAPRWVPCSPRSPAGGRPRRPRRRPRGAARHDRRRPGRPPPARRRGRPAVAAGGERGDRPCPGRGVGRRAGGTRRAARRPRLQPHRVPARLDARRRRPRRRRRGSARPWCGTCATPRACGSAPGAERAPAGRPGDERRPARRRRHRPRGPRRRRCRREELSIRQRRAALLEHAAIARRARLAGRAGVRAALHPSVSILLPTRRPDLLGHALAQVTRQRVTLPGAEVELVLAAHGFTPDPDLVDAASELGGVRTTIVEATADTLFGDVLRAGHRRGGRRRRPQDGRRRLVRPRRRHRPAARPRATAAPTSSACPPSWSTSSRSTPPCGAPARARTTGASSPAAR